MAINNAINQYPIVDALLGTWTPGAGTITSADSILTALQKISGSSVALSGNNVWTGTNSFGNTVTFSTLTASTVPYLDASKNLTSSAVTPTELGYVSGVTSAIQTQLNAKASGSGYTASRVMISDGTGALVVSPDITTTELGYLNGATGTTGTGNLVFSASPTFTGTAIVSAITMSSTLIMASNASYYGRLGQLVSIATDANYGGVGFTTFSSTTDQAILLDLNRSKSGTIGVHTVVADNDALGYLVFRGSDGTTFLAACYIAGMADVGTQSSTSMPGRLEFWTTPDGSLTTAKRMIINRSGAVTIGATDGVGLGAFYAGSGAFTDRIQVSGNISFPGAASGNAYIYHSNDLGLVIYGEGTSLDLLFANKSGGTVMSVTTNTQNVDFAGAVNVVSNVTIGGQATATSVGLEIGNTAGGTPFIDFKSSAIDYDVRIINGAANTLSFIGASAGYFFDATINSIYSIVATSATATLTTITQGITTAGNLVTSAYVADGYTAGLTWSSTTDNSNNPKAGIFCKTTGSGTYVYIGTSNDYATGITTASSIGPNGEMEIGSITTAGKIQVGSTTPTASSGAAFTVNTDLTTGSAGSASLMIQGASNKERIAIFSAGASGGGPLLNMFSFRGSIASPTATQLGDLLSGVSGGGYGATGYSGNQYVFLQYATENWTDSAKGCYTAFFTVPNGSTSLTGRLLIDHDGSVTLGSGFGSGTGALYAGTGTFTGLLTTVASATGSAGLRIPHGTAPSSPTNGDIWTTTAGAFIRINGVTKTFTLT